MHRQREGIRLTPSDQPPKVTHALSSWKRDYGHTDRGFRYHFIPVTPGLTSDVRRQTSDFERTAEPTPALELRVADTAFPLAASHATLSAATTPSTLVRLTRALLALS